MMNREDSIDGTLNAGTAGKASMMASESTDVPGARKKRYPTDRPYFIAKEILMTERTYKKDLEVINLVSSKYGRSDAEKIIKMLFFSSFSPFSVVP